jgi:hypothetical protein
VVQARVCKTLDTGSIPVAASKHRNDRRAPMSAPTAAWEPFGSRSSAVDEFRDHARDLGVLTGVGAA